MAYRTLTLKAEAAGVSQALLDRHYFRKHGANATYGQGAGKTEAATADLSPA
jgi:L-ribulose-5-phosphate 4-epimerase